MKFLDLFMALSEAITPAPAAPVPPVPPVIQRAVFSAKEAKPAALKSAVAMPEAAEPMPQVERPRYRLADAYGTTFEHEDPAFLRQWIEARNASFRPVQQPAFFYQSSSRRTCGPSGCR